MRCSPGTQLIYFLKRNRVPHLRCIRFALHRVRDTKDDAHPSRYNALALSRYSMAFCLSVILNLMA